MTFETLEQRLAQTYIETLPRFKPDVNEIVSISEQEHFYTIIKSLYQLAYDYPLLFVSILHEDDAFPNRFNKSSYSKPGLLKDMRKFTKSIDELLKNMFLMGQGNNIVINKRYKVILNRLGINDLNNLPVAWVWMSKRPEASLTTFMYCFFDIDYNYISEIYSRLLGDEAAFQKLENWMVTHGYKRYDISNVSASDCGLSMTYANPEWSKEPPRGGFQYKIKHTGISTRYDPIVQIPSVFGLCIPNGMKLYLDSFDMMERQVQSFVIARTKKCDGCRYCVQTDKKGLRPLAGITVVYEQKKYNLCPYFPGYYYCWTYINDELVEDLIAMLSFMDSLLPKNVKRTN